MQSLAINGLILYNDKVRIKDKYILNKGALAPCPEGTIFFNTLEDIAPSCVLRENLDILAIADIIDLKEVRA